ncbi:MAG: Phosphotransferase enzyme family [Candidatus Parcubacteria bacterium]|jgi:fructosamine-3-kinase
MKTKIADVPLIHGWMTPANKRFRKNFIHLARRLPEVSFLDAKSFVIDGFFVGYSVGSVVMRVRDKSGVYVVKSSVDGARIEREAAFLKQWRTVGVNTVKVLALIPATKTFPATVEILEYISTGTTEEEMHGKNKSQVLSLYTMLGRTLAKIKKAKGSGYGEVASLKKFTGQYKTYGEQVREIFTPKHIRELHSNKLATKEETQLIERAITIVEADAKQGRGPVLVHNDLGLFNTFGIKAIKVFDPVAQISHPFVDVAVSLIWASFGSYPALSRAALLKGYGFKARDEQVLQAVMYLKIMERWLWWLKRSKSEREALSWIRKTRSLFNTAKKSITLKS